MTEGLEEFLTKFSDRFPYHDVESLCGIDSSTKLQESTPRLEMVKLAKLIKAHTTKVGLLSNRSCIEGNEATLRNQLEELEQSLFYLLSLFPVFHRSGHYAAYFLKHLDKATANLLGCVKELYVQILGKSGDLVSVGRIWSLCDELNAIADQGNLGLLKKHITNSTKLLNDTDLELNDWLENPSVYSEDPFDLDSVSDSEHENTDIDSAKLPEDLVAFVQILQKNVKSVKILLDSFNKSIFVSNPHSKSTIRILEELDDHHEKLVEHVDEFVSSVFMLGADFDKKNEDIIEDIEKFNEITSSMSELMKKLNGDDHKKKKLVEDWESQWQKIKYV